MPSRTAAVAILLALFIQYTEGFHKVIVISELHDYDDQNDTRVTGDHSGSDISGSSYCLYGNCSCSSFYNALTNLTSNVLINITTDVTLSSIVSLVGLANITLTGHNNPTVRCNNSGGLHFISCYNCTIEGIS